MHKQPPNTRGETNENWYEQVNEILGPPLGWPQTRPNGALQAPEHNYTDFRNHDVPAYYHRLSSRDLLNARGQTVKVEGRDRPTYFPETTFAIVKRQIEEERMNSSKHLQSL